MDALTFLTPLIERRRFIIVGTMLCALVVGLYALLTPRKYEAQLSLTPVTASKSGSALGGIAALAGATLNTGYQLTPARMVELIRSRTVLVGVGMSRLSPNGSETIVDRLVGERDTKDDPEDVKKRIDKLLTVGTNKETGTVSVGVRYRDSSLARIIASRVVDSASQIFVRTSKAQAQQLRVAQERRVDVAATNLRQAEERLRAFSFANRAAPPFSEAGIERDRINREIRFAEDVYNQAATDRESAFARELEATPTVVVQDPLPSVLTRVRRRVIMKAGIAGIVSLFAICFAVLIVEVTRRRLARADTESDRFRRAVSTIPLVKTRGS